MKYFFKGLIVALIFLSACKNKSFDTSPKPNAGNDVKESVNPYVKADQSPMDMSWCPAQYPVQKMQGNDTLKLIARVIYSRPHKKGRLIFGTDSSAICKYGSLWRLGANEATEINFFENVNIAGQNISKGTYVLHCIPHADRWTILINSTPYTWGLDIKESSDILRTDIPVMPQSPNIEDFTIAFENTQAGADMIMAWDNVKTSLPITFSKY